MGSEWQTEETVDYYVNKILLMERGSVVQTVGA